MCVRHHRQEEHAGAGDGGVGQDQDYSPIFDQVSKQLVPFFVGLTVLGIGICFGFNCGYAVNPARDFAPRLFTGKHVLTELLYIIVFSYSHGWVGP